MDNITHSVLGLVVGDAAHHTTNPRQLPSVERRRLFLLSSVLASNLPDADIVLNKLLPAPIGPLLHHRGYTHTLIAVLPQALFVMAVLLLLRGTILSKKLDFRDWSLAFLTAVVAALLHVFADSWNSYGVHPFFPFNNDWYYGDFIFIIEPILWACMGAWVLVELPLFWRFFIFGIFSLVLGYGFNIGAIDQRQIFSLLGLLLICIFVVSFFSTSKRSLGVLSILIFVLGLFKFQSFTAERLAKADYSLATLQPMDVALSPLPANPFCWIAVVANQEGYDLVIRKGAISLWTERFLPSSCRLLDQNLTPVSRVANSAHINWYREHRTSLREFEKYKSDCFLTHWLQFARMPAIENGVALDIRFSSRGIRNFTELQLVSNRACLTQIPPWNPPIKYFREKVL